MFSLIVRTGCFEAMEERGDLAAAMFELTAEFLHRAGYEHYEISSFALPGYGSRWENPSTLAKYAAAVKSQELSVNELKLSRKDAMSEFMFLGLRLLAGVDKVEFAGQFGMEVEDAFPGVIGSFTEKGLLTAAGSNLRLTAKGLLLANVVMQEFV